MEYHKPVLLHETLDGLALRPDGIYVDVTFGGGGHSRALLAQLGPEGRLYAFDQDSDAKANAIDDCRFKLINENFRHLKSYLRLEGVRIVDGIVADLGISSHQIDVAERGFSTRMDGALDLRMDCRSPSTAADLVNSLEEEDLKRILKMYGELPNAGAMAKAICAARRTKAIETTTELKEAVSRHLPRGYENKYLAMLFQSLRIEVNGELEALKDMLEQGCEILREGGRMAVISYHSLEDRIVKNFFKTGNFDGEESKDFYGNRVAPMKVVTRKVVTASDAELAENPRARSAKLRIAEKCRQGNKDL